MKSLHKTRKQGQITSIFFIIAMMLSIVIVILIGKVIFTGFADSPQLDRPSDKNQKARVLTDQFQDVGYTSLGNMFMILFIGSLTILIVIAFSTRTHPLFFPITAFVILPLAIFIASIISNVYDKLIQNETISVQATTLLNLIMQNLPMYIFGFGAILLVILYGVNRLDGQV